MDFLAVVFVHGQHAEITLAINLDRKINGCAANKAIFYVVLLAATGVHYQLIGFTTVRASDIGGFGVIVHWRTPE
jgi:hypothetical protein